MSDGVGWMRDKPCALRNPTSHRLMINGSVRSLANLATVLLREKQKPPRASASARVGALLAATTGGRAKKTQVKLEIQSATGMVWVHFTLYFPSQLGDCPIAGNTETASGGARRGGSPAPPGRASEGAEKGGSPTWASEKEGGAETLGQRRGAEGAEALKA
eukprot:9471363-Pyramimonas_sp.AAC.2